MQIKVALSQSVSAQDIATDLRSQLGTETPSVLLVHYDCMAAVEDMQANFLDLGENLHAATSCLGAMTGQGHTTSKDGGAGAFAIYDPDGDYGTACLPFDGDASQAARDATEQALAKAGREGEAPDLIWLSTSPGQEENVLHGIIDVVGEDVPIIGGSAADNAIAGDWRMFDATQVAVDGVLLTVMFPSTGIAFAYQNGYAPMEKAGHVTKAGGRRIFEIDNRPAATVYAEWTSGGAVAGIPDGDENILAQSTLWPLGREIAAVGGISQFLLAHPAGAHSDGSLSLFADIAEGEVLTQMTGDVMALADRAGRVATMAASKEISPENVAGALMVYCGGCMLAVRDHMDRVVHGVNAALPDIPMLGTFTFGEQGPIQNSGSRHGNLMISCIVFESAE